MGGHAEVVSFLLGARAASIDAPRKFQDHPNHDGATPLLIAADRGHSGVVRLLLTAGAKSVDAAKACGCTPLFMAAQNGHLEVTIMLLDARARVDCTLPNGKTPLSAARAYGNATVCAVLLQHG